MPSEDTVWGIIVPIGRLIPGKIDLTKSEYTFGKSNWCDCQIQDDPNRPNPWFEFFSWYHFRIEKDVTESETHFYIQDLSDHGTYVNGKKIGKNNKRPLKPDSEISLVVNKNKAFVFIVENPEDSADIPEIIKSRYAISKTLGKGAFGKVRQLFSYDGSEKVAMKYMKKPPPDEVTDIEQFREIQIMQDLTHPCIIQILETVDTPHFLYIIMELAEGGTLNQRLKWDKTLTETTTRIIVHQVLLAVEYLHDEGITHRDLKPDNILLASERDQTLIKLTDFGSAKAVNDDPLMETFAGTPLYIAPEMWGKLLGEVSNYSNAVDVWSIGIIMYKCIAGDLPVIIRNHEEYIHNKPANSIIKQKFSSSIYFRDKPQAEDLGLKLLKVEATERISVKDALKHNWFQDRLSRKCVENLTGLTLEDSGKASMNIISTSRKPLIPKNQQHHKPDVQLQQKSRQKEQEENQPHHATEARHHLKRQRESEEPYTSNRSKYHQPDQPDKPFSLSRWQNEIPARPYSLSYVQDGPYSQSWLRELDKPYSPHEQHQQQGTSNPPHQLQQPERTYSYSQLPGPNSQSQFQHQPGRLDFQRRLQPFKPYVPSQLPKRSNSLRQPQLRQADRNDFPRENKQPQRPYSLISQLPDTDVSQSQLQPQEPRRPELRRRLQPFVPYAPSPLPHQKRDRPSSVNNPMTNRLDSLYSSSQQQNQESDQSHSSSQLQHQQQDRPDPASNHQPPSRPNYASIRRRHTLQHYDRDRKPYRPAQPEMQSQMEVVAESSNMNDEITDMQVPSGDNEAQKLSRVQYSDQNDPRDLSKQDTGQNTKNDNQQVLAAKSYHTAEIAVCQLPADYHKTAELPKAKQLDQEDLTLIHPQRRSQQDTSQDIINFKKQPLIPVSESNSNRPDEIAVSNSLPVRNQAPNRAKAKADRQRQQREGLPQKDAAQNNVLNKQESADPQTQYSQDKVAVNKLSDGSQSETMLKAQSNNHSLWSKGLLQKYASQNDHGQQQGGLPQQDADQSAINGNLPSKSNLVTNDSQLQYRQKGNASQEFQSRVEEQKKQESQESSSREGIDLTPKSFLKTQQSNFKSDEVSRSSNRSQIGVKGPLGDLNYIRKSALEASRTRPWSIAEGIGLPTSKQAQAPDVFETSDRPFQQSDLRLQQETAVHQPNDANRQQSQHQKQFQNIPQKFVKQVDNSGMEAKHEPIGQNANDLQELKTNLAGQNNPKSQEQLSIPENSVLSQKSCAKPGLSSVESGIVSRSPIQRSLSYSGKSSFKSDQTPKKLPVQGTSNFGHPPKLSNVLLKPINEQAPKSPNTLSKPLLEQAPKSPNTLPKPMFEQARKSPTPNTLPNLVLKQAPKSPNTLSKPLLEQAPKSPNTLPKPLFEQARKSPTPNNSSNLVLEQAPRSPNTLPKPMFEQTPKSPNTLPRPVFNQAPQSPNILPKPMLEQAPKSPNTLTKPLLEHARKSPTHNTLPNLVLEQAPKSPNTLPKPMFEQAPKSPNTLPKPMFEQAPQSPNLPKPMSDQAPKTPNVLSKSNFDQQPKSPNIIPKPPITTPNSFEQAPRSPLSKVNGSPFKRTPVNRKPVQASRHSQQLHEKSPIVVQNVVRKETSV